MLPEIIIGVFALCFIVGLAILSINRGDAITKLRNENDNLRSECKSYAEQIIVLEAQRDVFCKGTVTVTLNAEQVDPKQVEYVAALIRHNLTKADKKLKRF